MPNGNLAIPKMTGSAGASWVGETAPAPKNTPTFGEVNLRAKKLSAMTLVSNSLLRYTGVGLDSWISSDLMEKARIKLDEAFLDGIGSEFTPRLTCQRPSRCSRFLKTQMSRSTMSSGF